MPLEPLQTSSRKASRRPAAAPTRRVFRRSPIGESLEARQLLSASLGPIANLNVPALQGSTLPLNGSGTTDPQTFSAVSTNPDIAVSIVSTTFWNVGVSYTDPTDSNNNITGTLTFALFGSLTPHTVQMISQFTNDGYYVDTGKYFPRIVTDFAGTATTVVQGGSANLDGTGTSGQPGTPFANENLQQLALTGSDQLSMTNAGGTDSNDTQFFINTGPLDSQLGYGYTIFGQLVSGFGTLAEMAQVPVMANAATGELSEPVYPITITSASLSTTNNDGVVLIDTTQARPGETALITVTAQDSTDSTQAQQSFRVTVGSYSGPTLSSAVSTVNFEPYVSAVAATTVANTAMPIQLAGQATFPVPTALVSSYTIVSAPLHGSISNFDAATGTLTYTPAPGFAGTDTFTYTATSDGPNSSAPPATSNPATVTITVNQGVVTLRTVDLVTNSKNRVTGLELIWSGALDASIASSKAPYRLLTANRKGSFTGAGHATIAIRKVVYNAGTLTVTLTPRTLFPKSKSVELLVYGNGKNGLKDAFGQYIAGTDDESGTDSITIV
jgi:cyclophilin family peptidyl-prolyl cis-trans isomerase